MSQVPSRLVEVVVESRGNPMAGSAVFCHNVESQVVVFAVHRLKG